MSSTSQNAGTARSSGFSGDIKMGGRISAPNHHRQPYCKSNVKPTIHATISSLGPVHSKKSKKSADSQQDISKMVLAEFFRVANGSGKKKQNEQAMLQAFSKYKLLMEKHPPPPPKPVSADSKAHSRLKQQSLRQLSKDNAPVFTPMPAWPKIQPQEREKSRKLGTLNSKKLQRKLRVSLPNQQGEGMLPPDSFHQPTSSFKFENFRRTAIEGFRKGKNDNDYQCTTQQMEELIRKSKSVLVEINQDSMRKGRNPQSSLPTASTGLSTFAKAKNLTRKDSIQDLQASDTLEEQQQPPLVTTGKSIFKRPSTQHLSQAQVKVLQERKGNQTPPVQRPSKSTMVRIRSESNFHQQQFLQNLSPSPLRQEYLLQIPGASKVAKLPGDSNSTINYSKSRNTESKRRTIALIYDPAIRISLSNKHRMNRRKLIARTPRQNANLEESNRSTPSRSQSPIIYHRSKKSKQIEYLRASIGNCQNRSMLSSISFKSPLKIAQNQSIGGNEERSSQKSTRLVLKKTQIHKKRHKLQNLYQRGQSARSRNELIIQNKSTSCNSYHLQPRLLTTMPEADQRLNLDLPGTPRMVQESSRVPTQRQSRNLTQRQSKSSISQQESLDDSQNFSFLKPQHSGKHTPTPPARDSFAAGIRKSSLFKKSRHQRKKALGEDDFLKISSSFIEPSIARSRANPELSNKTTDLVYSQREATQFPITRPALPKRVLQLQGLPLGERKDEEDNCEIGTFRVSSSRLKIKRNSILPAIAFDPQLQKKAAKPEQSAKEVEQAISCAKILDNLDTSKISLSEEGSPQKELEQSFENREAFDFSIVKDDGSMEGSSKKDSGKELLWDANNLLDQSPERCQDGNSLSSLMIMEMMRKNKEKQKRQKLVRNISNADTQEFRSHRSISDIFEAAEEEQDGFLGDDCQDFVRRFNTTGAQLTSAIVELGESIYASAKK